MEASTAEELRRRAARCRALAGALNSNDQATLIEYAAVLSQQAADTEAEDAFPLPLASPR